MTPVFRFAPSPNGRMHLGHAYSAWLNAEMAARLGGRFLLRLEDIDTTRCTPKLAQACLDDLAWLGLSWEAPVRVQSKHFDDYTAAFGTLKAAGLVYPCFCTRREVANASTAHDPDGAPLYPGTCRALTDQEAQVRMAAGKPHSWRLKMDAALGTVKEPLSYAWFDPNNGAEEAVIAYPERWGDVVLVRKETPTSYHLSVVVDDAIQAITHVVRGRDLDAATDVHVLLQRLLDLPPPRYFHHGLIPDDMGGKLAKSRGSESLADLRKRGVTAAKVREMLTAFRSMDLA